MMTVDKFGRHISTHTIGKHLQTHPQILQQHTPRRYTVITFLTDGTVNASGEFSLSKASGGTQYINLFYSGRIRFVSIPLHTDLIINGSPIPYIGYKLRLNDVISFRRHWLSLTNDRQYCFEILLEDDVLD